MNTFSSATQPRVVVVGSYGVGLTFSMERVPEAGETVVGHSFSIDDGGKGSNQAIAASRLGAAVTLCTVVGSDQYGRRAHDLWDTEQVDSRLVRTVDGNTMVGMIVVDGLGENRIAIVPGVLDAFAPQHLIGLDEALIGADVLVVGLEIPVATAHAALLAGRRAGVTTVLNPAPAPPGPLPAETLALVDHLTPNRTEAARLAGLPSDTAPETIIEADCFAAIATVALTLGADGVLLRHHGADVAISAIAVSPVVDTTGAGDSFTAAYAVRLASGDNASAAAIFAVRAAGHCVGIAHVIPSLPYLGDLAPLAPGTPAMTGTSNTQAIHAEGIT